MTMGPRTTKANTLPTSARMKVASMAEPYPIVCVPKPGFVRRWTTASLYVPQNGPTPRFKGNRGTVDEECTVSRVRIEVCSR